MHIYFVMSVRKRKWYQFRRYTDVDVISLWSNEKDAQKEAAYLTKADKQDDYYVFSLPLDATAGWGREMVKNAMKLSLSECMQHVAKDISTTVKNVKEYPKLQSAEEELRDDTHLIRDAVLNTGKVVHMSDFKKREVHICHDVYCFNDSEHDCHDGACKD